MACKYYLFIAEIATLDALQHSLYITSSSEQFQLAGVFHQIRDMSYCEIYNVTEIGVWPLKKKGI